MRKATIIVFGLLLSINGQAQTPRRSTKGTALRVKSTATMPTVDAVLEKYVKALGGKAAIQKLTSRVAKGTFELSSLAGVKGSVEIYAKAPNKQLAIINIPGVGTDAEGFDGMIAWAVEPDSGVVHEKSGLDLDSARREADFYEDLNLKELYPRMTLKGAEKVGVRSAYVIEAVPQVGNPEKFYFDMQTGLLIRKDTEEEGAEGKRSVVEYYEDYRMVDGIKLPFLIRQQTPGMDLIIKLTDIKHNVTIDDAKFNKPEDQ